MKIAILLALHNEPEQANYFIDQCLTYPGTEVFIHIDSKGEWITDYLRKNDRVHIMPLHLSVQWGDYTQIRYVIELIKWASSMDTFDYYSLHSGNDMVTRPWTELTAYLEENKKYAYLDCHPLPWKHWQYGGGLGRLALTWPASFRQRLKPHSVKRYARAIYGRLYGAHILKGKALPNNIQFWGKSAFFTLSGECAAGCLEYIDSHPEFLDLFRYALCGDEIFFPSIVNIIGKDKEIEENNNLRYVDFQNEDKKNVGSPKTLVSNDIERINASGAFFARKIDRRIDEKIMQYYMGICLGQKDVNDP